MNTIKRPMNTIKSPMNTIKRPNIHSRESRPTQSIQTISINTPKRPSECAQRAPDSLFSIKRPNIHSKEPCKRSLYISTSKRHSEFVQRVPDSHLTKCAYAHARARVCVQILRRARPATNRQRQLECVARSRWPVVAAWESACGRARACDDRGWGGGSVAGVRLCGCHRSQAYCARFGCIE